MPDRPAPVTGHAVPVALLATGLLLTALDAVLIVRWGTRGLWYSAGELIQMLAWLLTGYLATRLRPHAPIGRLMLALGVVLAGNSPGGLGLADGTPALGLLQVIAPLFFGLQLPLGAHTLLTYPVGRLRDRPVRVYLAVAYPVSLAIGVIFACRPSWLPLALQLNGVISVLAVLVGMVIFARRVRRSGPRERRVLLLPVLGIGLFGLVFALWQLKVVLFHAAGLLIPVPMVEFTQAVSVIGVPVTFVAGLARQRWDEAAVAHLVRELAGTPVAGLRPALARTLGDPLAEFGLADGDGFRAADGIRLTLPGRDAGGDPAAGERTATLIGDPDAPQAVIIHDRSLRQEPTLLEAVAEAVRFVLENARLQAELRGRLLEARETSARLVAAQDTARRRLERDLHDGAQQQMLAAGLAVQLLRRRLEGADDSTLALLEETQGALRTALAEMRQLARGIHPAVLTSDGLSAALDQLSRRCPVPARVVLTEPVPRLPAAVEATAYFVACEALANVVKHADATRVTLTVTAAGGHLRLTVADDGRGGATTGPGVTGLRDRTAALGGELSLHSPPGGGTRLRMELPCG
ncbi:sensor histidine kinase [Actinoplanes sp. NPDC049599]|uniref:sensor histidine kinase n=1 Tax=Actinoplanes sp. NPDC049599 TaxID=3363903 RepID=UPI0037B7D7D1